MGEGLPPLSLSPHYILGFTLLKLPILSLPIIRTSVDHGVAFGKAGEGRANEESMVEAIKMAIDFAN